MSSRWRVRTPGEAAPDVVLGRVTVGEDDDVVGGPAPFPEHVGQRAGVADGTDVGVRSAFAVVDTDDGGPSVGVRWCRRPDRVADRGDRQGEQGGGGYH